MIESFDIRDEQAAPAVAEWFRDLVEELGQVQDAKFTLELFLKRGCSLFQSECAIGMAFGEPGRPMLKETIGLEADEKGSLLSSLQTWLTKAFGEPSLDPIFINHTDEANASVLSGLDDTSFRSCLILPLVQRGNLMGIISFFYRHPHIFTDLQSKWMPFFSRLASLVLENNQLVDLTIKQAVEMGAFYEIASAAADGFELSDLLGQVLTRAKLILDCHMGLMFLSEKNGKGFQPIAHHGIPEEVTLHALEYGEQLAERVIQRRAPIVISMHPPWSCEDLESEAKSHQIQVLCLPMIWHDRLVGVMQLYAGASREPYSDADIHRAKSFAYQAANILGIAGLLESEREHRRMAEALQAAAVAVSGEIDLDEVLDRILEQVIEAFHCDAANFQILEGERSLIIHHRGYERFGHVSEDLMGMGLEIDEYRNISRMLSGEVLAISDTQQDDSWVHIPEFRWLRSWAGAPIQYGQKTLGFINLDSATPGTFGEETIRPLKAFAAHAAAAMHKADLYKKLADQHGQLQALHEIEEKISRANLAVDDILSSLLDSGLSAIDGVYAAAYKFNPSKDQISKCASRTAESGLEEGLEQYGPVETLVTQTIHENALAADNVDFASTRYRLSSIPISSADSVWGALLLCTRGETPLDVSWLEVLQSAAQRAALAIATAEQHAEVQRRLSEMTILQRIVSHIARRLDVDELLSEVTDHLHVQMGFPAVQVYRREGDYLVLQQSSGPKPIVERLSVDRGIIGRVFRTGEPSLVENVREDPDYVSSLVGTRAKLTVPIQIEDEVVGVLNVESSDPSQVEQSALELLVLLADQVSVALQNAMLYEQVQESVAHLEEQVRKRTAELEQALTQAESADMAKAQFVSDISHELRTPLTNIGLYLDLLEMGDATNQSEYMLTLRRETNRLGSLIEQLLAISHLDSGRASLKPRPTDVNSLVKMLAVDRARMMEERGLVLEILPGEAIPEAQVDPQYVIQALTNLMTNAMNYTPEGGKITIETDSETWHDQTWITVTVSDTGPGIPEAEKKQIFDRFYRGLVGRSSGIPGTGLGLSISKEIAERHGGRIQVVSASGEGASFRLWLPVVEEGDL